VRYGYFIRRKGRGKAKVGRKGASCVCAVREERNVTSLVGKDQTITITIDTIRYDTLRYDTIRYATLNATITKLSSYFQKSIIPKK